MMNVQMTNNTERNISQMTAVLKSPTRALGTDWLKWQQ